MTDEEFLEFEKSFFEDLPLPRERNGLWGYIGHNDNEVIQFIYDEADHFYDHLALVRMGSQVGFIDISGKTAIPFMFEDAKGFCNGYSVVKIDGKWGAIDMSGNIVVEPRYDYIEDFHESGSQMVAEAVIDGYKGVINTSEEILVPFYS